MRWAGSFVVCCAVLQGRSTWALSIRGRSDGVVQLISAWVGVVTTLRQEPGMTEFTL
jgi:hypothetical protein